MNMKTTKKITFVVLVCIFFVSGCMSFNPKSMRIMENALLESNPDLDIESEFTIGLGALTIDFIDFAFIHDKRLDLSKISKADIGIFELSQSIATEDFQIPTMALADRNCPLQTVIVKVREEDETIQVAVCIKNDTITGLTVFVLEPKEIVVVRARGNFEAMIASLVKPRKNREERTLNNVVALQ